MSEPLQRINLTGERPGLEYVEVVTDAGTVRVNVGLVSTQTGRPVVAVNVEPSRDDMWETEVRRRSLANTDVVLTRKVPSAEGALPACEFCGCDLVRLTVRWLAEDTLSDFCEKSSTGFHKPGEGKEEG